MTPAEILTSIGHEPRNPRPFGPTRDGTATAWTCDGGTIYLDRSPTTPYVGRGSAMLAIDDARRAHLIERQACGRRVLDFGSGLGGFVGRVRECAAFAIGYEPSAPDAITWSSVAHQGPYDIATAWHVVEHLDDPIEALTRLSGIMAPGALLVVEVPHARDWLLHSCGAFRAFSLWSEHRILHTRETLRSLLQCGGFDVERIEAVQRYPLANHLHWLTRGMPGGVDVNENLDREYAAMLAARDETDTLIAWARKG